ncbi:hypothetical protein LIER_01925 [Lithospermum erythrorhizon]|uniref:Protein kinase domain-containing protein n=1 Tax=Lithospermum erythrorhizon TaxID=34254 RepID=A0AAV3NRD9_LITER
MGLHLGTHNIGKLLQLQKLDIGNNRLSGQILSSVGNLTVLNQLDLNSNRLDGEIPTSQGNCQRLTQLELSDNKSIGNIPKEIFQISSLALILNLSDNHFSGQIPAEVKNLGQLGKLDLSHNEMSDKIPKGGIFADSNAVSFSGNNRLCGGIHELHFPRCRKTKQNKSSLIIIILVLSCSAFVGLAATLTLVIFCVNKGKKRIFQSESSEPSLRKSALKLTYAMLHKATEGFSSKNFLGKGSSGTVYKGFLHNGNKYSAVKVQNVQEQEGARSFHAECNALSKLRHRNLVKILSACSSIDFQRRDFKALVYDFLPNGNLERWLHPYVDEKGGDCFKEFESS